MKGMIKLKIDAIKDMLDMKNNDPVGFYGNTHVDVDNLDKMISDTIKLCNKQTNIWEIGADSGVYAADVFYLSSKDPNYFKSLELDSDYIENGVYEHIIKLYEGYTSDFYTDGDKYKNLLKYSQAELQNATKRHAVESNHNKVSVKINTLQSILSLYDELAIAKKELYKSVDDKTRSGLDLIFSKLDAFLKNSGLNMIENTKFDSNRHDAISVMKIDGMEDNQIIDILSHGWLMGDKVIKHSKVVVNKV